MNLDRLTRRRNELLEELLNLPNASIWEWEKKQMMIDEINVLNEVCKIWDSRYDT